MLPGAAPSLGTWWRIPDLLSDSTEETNYVFLEYPESCQQPQGDHGNDQSVLDHLGPILGLESGP
jgi:hypothetical protein